MFTISGCRNVTMYQTIHFKYVEFSVDQLYLNKVLRKPKKTGGKNQKGPQQAGLGNLEIANQPNYLKTIAGRIGRAHAQLVQERHGKRASGVAGKARGAKPSRKERTKHRPGAAENPLNVSGAPPTDRSRDAPDLWEAEPGLRFPAGVRHSPCRRTVYIQESNVDQRHRQ